MLIVYYWPAKLAHVSCAITGLGRHSRYISYFPGNGSDLGCKIHTFTSDALLYKNYPPLMLVIPTQEDGFSWGLSETEIKTYWDAMSTLPEFSGSTQNCSKMIFDCINVAVQNYNDKSGGIPMPTFSGDACNQNETWQYYNTIAQKIKELSFAKQALLSKASKLGPSVVSSSIFCDTPAHKKYYHTVREPGRGVNIVTLSRI